MLNGLIGKKIGMTNIFAADGKFIPVTVIEAGPCVVVQKKTKEKEGYDAVTIGFEKTKKKKKVNKSQEKVFKKIEVEPLKYLKEFDCTEIESIKTGQVFEVDIFKEDEKVDVSGISKGKGFAGVMKRHNFHGYPASRGTHEYFRHGGSIGQHTFPGKTFKNVGMPGRMGGERVTVQNVKVVKIIKEDNLILIKGAIPGANGTIVEIRKC